MFKHIKRIIKLILLLGIIAFGINIYVVAITASQIERDVELSIGSIDFGNVTVNSAKSIDPQCIMILGAGIYDDGSPTPMLKGRLETGIALYREGLAPKLLLSGDNGREGYDEVGAMKKYALEKGVPEEDIFLDHAGFSTYDSVYRAKYIFGVERMIVVTQKYHLYRALYGCRHMDIQAIGVAADLEKYRHQEVREVREVLARNKDAVKWLIKPEPTFLGDRIPIEGDGKVTDTER